MEDRFAIGSIGGMEQASGRFPLAPEVALRNLSTMVHQLVLLKLRSEVSPEKVEEILRQTRSSLLKIPEVLAVKCGKNVDPGSEWGVFVAADFESIERLTACQQAPIYTKYNEEVLEPNTIARMVLAYEMEPGKDVRFS